MFLRIIKNIYVYYYQTLYLGLYSCQTFQRLFKIGVKLHYTNSYNSRLYIYIYFLRIVSRPLISTHINLMAQLSFQTEIYLYLALLLKGPRSQISQYTYCLIYIKDSMSNSTQNFSFAKIM